MTVTLEQVNKDVSEEVAYRNLLMRMFNKTFPRPNPDSETRRSPRFCRQERDWEFTFHTFTWVIAKVNIDSDEAKEMWQHVGGMYRTEFIKWMDELVLRGMVATPMAERYAELAM